MMGDAGFEAPGTEGAADIHIETGPKVKLAEFSNLNPLIRKTPHDQGICTGLCLHKISKFYRGWKPLPHKHDRYVGAASSRELCVKIF
jgi:hypothetical protein